MITKRVLLDAEKSLGYGYLLTHCAKHQQINVNVLQDGDYWHCVECQKPLLINLDGQFYLIGENVTI